MKFSPFLTILWSPPLINLFLSLLFISEGTHLISHFLVISRLDLPRCETVENNLLYFIWDMTSPLLTSIVIGKVSLVILFHFFGHICYLLFWYTDFLFVRQMITWTSMEYEGPIITKEFFLTLFDICVHAYMCTCIYYYQNYGYSFKLPFSNYFTSNRNVTNLTKKE